MADLNADHIVRYLDNAGYVVMKKVPAPGGGDSPGRRGVPGRYATGCGGHGLAAAG
jgi:hypothetical protein